MNFKTLILPLLAQKNLISMGEMMIKKNFLHLSLALLMSTVTTVTFANTTIIHVGELLAVPGQKSKHQQTIVVEDQNTRRCL